MGVSDILFKAIDVSTFGLQNPPHLLLEYSKGIDRITNIQYYSEAEECKLDIYRPSKPNKNKLPIVIQVHGGGFVAGLKEARNCLSYYISNKCNCIVLNLEYGKSPNYTFLNSLNQLFQIFSFIDKYKETYGMDTDSITLIGDSSGAYFALYLSLLSNNALLQEKLNMHTSFIINKVILDCGFYDYDSLEKGKMPDNVVEELFKYLTGENIKEIDNYRYKDFLTPLKFINGTNLDYLIAYSIYDPLASQSEKLVNILENLNMKYNLCRSTSLEDNHCFPIMWISKKAKEFNKMMIDFINNNLKK